MLRRLQAATLIFFLYPSANLFAEEYVALDTYTCGDFLDDTKQPPNGARLLRSFMMISWAAGFVAAHQSGTPRADPRAIQGVAGAVGNECRARNSQTVVQATLAALDQIAKSDTVTKSPNPNSTELPPKQQGKFTLYDHFDLLGGDLRRLERVELGKCRTTCEPDLACSAYSYDKLNRWCFLKSKPTALSLDPGSISAVRDDAPQPSKSTSEIRFDPRNAKALSGSHQEAKSTSGKECEQKCLQDSQCLGYTFATKTLACSLFNEIANISANRFAISGLKTQAP